jgi:hypothetical protein
MEERDHLDIVDFIENTFSYHENSIDAYRESEIDLNDLMLKILNPTQTQLDLMDD